MNKEQSQTVLRAASHCDYCNNDTTKNMRDAMYVKRLIIILFLDRLLECFLKDNDENMDCTQEYIKELSNF